MKSEHTVIVKQSVYKKLLDDSIFLGCLREAGVDNWSGYEEAISLYHSLDGEDE